MAQHGGSPPGPSEGAPRATGDAPGQQGKKRFSARRKVEIVLRLRRGEDLKLLSRELGVTAGRSLIRRDGVFLLGLGHVPLVEVVVDARGRGFDAPEALADGGQGLGGGQGGG